jgi:hypothetical protein
MEIEVRKTRDGCEHERVGKGEHERERVGKREREGECEHEGDGVARSRLGRA